MSRQEARVGVSLDRLIDERPTPIRLPDDKRDPQHDRYSQLRACQRAPETAETADHGRLRRGGV